MNSSTRIALISGILLTLGSVGFAQQTKPSSLLNPSVSDAPKPLVLEGTVTEAEKGRSGATQPGAAGTIPNRKSQIENPKDWRSAWQAKWLRKQEKEKRSKAEEGTAGAALVLPKSEQGAGGRTPNAQTPKRSNDLTPNTPMPAAVTGLTKPDVSVPAGTSANLNTLDSPTAAVGGSGKMFLFLAPMLLATWGALKLLQRYQQKTGRLPRALENAARPPAVKSARTGGLIGAILGGFNLNSARERGGSSIRVVESVPIGGVNIHLVEVRGKLLLLGASGGAVNLLTEFQTEEIDGGDFRALLNAAASEMHELSDDRALPAAAVVGSLEDDMRGTGDALQRRLRRLRTVQEAEADPDLMRFDNAR
jgi:flagellar biogenesis protein FliO